MQYGLKFDQGKVQLHLIPYEPQVALARIYMHGVEKYGLNNWRKGFPWSQLYNSARRHLDDWFHLGVDIDESGMLSLAHALWNVNTLTHFAITGLGTDDRLMRGVSRYVKEDDNAKEGFTLP